MNSPAELDIGPLSWVKGEIDLALERASTELAAGPAGDALKKARASLHQAHGALAIVGLDGLIEFAEAIEQLLAAMAEEKAGAEAGAAAQAGIAALRGYLDDLMAGHPNQPLKLFHPYRAMAEARGLPVPSPADLFFPDLTQRPPKREKDIAPLAADALAARLKAARLGFERGLLKWIKSDPKGIAEMKISVAMIEATRPTPTARAYWWVTLGVLDALAAGGLPDAAEAKRFALRLGAQIKKLSEGENEVPDRALREALYLAAGASTGGEPLETLEIVRAAYRLNGLLPSDEPSDAERLLPHIRKLRELLAAAKDDWNRLCAGTAAALPPFHERAAKIAEEGAATEHPHYARLTAAILDQTDLLRRDPSRHNESLALEMATALLLAESALENFEGLDQTFTESADAIVDRLEALGRGEELGALEVPHLDAMSRRAQERLLLESVAREIRNNLGAIEQTLDAFFRDATRQHTLAALTTPIRQIEGALAVLGQERANAVLWECGQAIKDFAEPGFTPRPGDFEDVAKKLSALGFFVEQLQHGAPDIDDILEPVAPKAKVEEESPVPVAVPPAPTFSPAEEASAEADEEALPEFAVPAPEELAPALPTIEAPAPSEQASRLVNASAEELDAEMLGIFLEEANEVLTTIAEHLPRLHEAPDDQSNLTTLRRSFHTLKGSGRMVNLTELGETAWAVEQVMNRWLHEARAATPALIEMLDLAFDTFRAWVVQLETGGGSHYAQADVLVARCAVLDKDGEEEAPLVEEIAVTASGDFIPPEPTFEEAASADELAAEAEPVMKAVEEIAPPTTADVVAFPAPPPVRVGEVEVAPTLYNLYLDETRGHVATLQGTLGREEVPGQDAIRAAHTTASISAATGFMPIHFLAHALEAALLRLSQVEATPTEAQRFVFARCAGALEGMLGAVAERRMPGEEADLTAELEAMQPPAPEPAPAHALPEINLRPVERRATRMEDEIDEQLLPLYLEESVDLMRDIGEALRAWRATPDDNRIANTLQRALHTLKGSARMAGAMGCGELLHSMESRVEQAALMAAVQPATIDGLETSYDRAAMLIERLRNPSSATPEDELDTEEAPATLDVTVETGPEAESESSETAEASSTESSESAPTAAPAIASAVTAASVAAPATPAQVHLRVRTELVDQLVNEAGEVAIARARIEGEMHGLKTSLLDLTENVIRLRNQLREIEIQAESQMQSQQAMAAEHAQQFDPLEFDRFTRFQEITRMMAESVNDVTTVQHNLLKNLDSANAALVAQARLNRELSQRLMSVRMVPFESLAERLHRVVRQAAKDAGKRANLDIRQGQTEIDRSVLDKMAGPLEHLLRNSVAHGLEDPAGRAAAGKDAIGQITVSLAQEGNEIVIAIADDGAGLALERIRQRAVERGLLPADAQPDEHDLTQLIFQAGFSTAEQLTQLAGRGIGMDVVKSEAASLGGRIEVQTTTGQGAVFRVYLPLTLAVTQAVLVNAGNRHYAIPSSMVEQASELKPEAIAQIREAGGMEWLGLHYPWRYLPALLGEHGATPSALRRHWLLLIKGGSERVALEIDGLVGNQEIVVKAIGPQLARVVGIAGATVLGDGEVALILNPIALLSHAAAPDSGPATPIEAPAETVSRVPTVMIVDDSLTVRKISSRLLARHGYEVITAKDGVDALEQLGEVMPDAMLVDIEMPRMDGFDLARNIRADARLKHIPIIMITSRSADKHRNHAMEIGVNDYMGKPYDEDKLLARLAEFTGFDKGKA